MDNVGFQPLYQILYPGLWSQVLSGGAGVEGVPPSPVSGHTGGGAPPGQDGGTPLPQPGQGRVLLRRGW